MMLKLAAIAGLLVHYNGRAELHGEEREPAGDISIKATVENKHLDQFHGTLKHAFFFHDTANPGRDLADKAMEDNPDHLPHLRFEELGGEIRWAGEMAGGKFTIHQGISAKSDLVVGIDKLTKVSFVPKAGGAIELKFQVKCRPDEKQAGRLYYLIQKPISFSVEPPAAEAQIGTGG